VRTLPPFAEIALLSRPSASASVKDPRTGKALKTAEHCYVVIDDPSQSKACLDAFLRLSWCRGKGKAAGRLMLSKAGAVLVRGPVDACVGSPERLSFEGAAVIGAGLDLLPRTAQVIGGTGMLRASDLLEFAERHAPADRFVAVVTEAKNDPDFCERREKVQAKFRTEHVRQAVARGVPREKAEANYDEAFAAGTTKSGNWTFVPLTPEHVLYWPDGKRFTIADMQKDRSAFHRKECCDPTEGTSYQSRNCAIIYTNSPRIEIYSPPMATPSPMLRRLTISRCRWVSCWRRSWRRMRQDQMRRPTSRQPLKSRLLLPPRRGICGARRRRRGSTIPCCLPSYARRRRPARG
jgi:hypothetical protein